MPGVALVFAGGNGSYCECVGHPGQASLGGVDIGGEFGVSHAGGGEIWPVSASVKR